MAARPHHLNSRWNVRGGHPPNRRQTLNESTAAAETIRDLRDALVPALHDENARDVRLALSGGREASGAGGHRGARAAVRVDPQGVSA